MSESLNILFAGGGTGGHVYPGLALAAELERARPGCRISWVGTSDRLEATAVPRAGYEFASIDVQFIKGRRGVALARALSTLPAAGLQALRAVRRARPDAVIGLGGFVSGPVCAAAAATGAPVFLLEQNATPGITNRMVSTFARTVYASFDASTAHFPAGKVKVLGNPVRGELIAAAGRSRPRRPGPPRVLVFGGSQGATSINRDVPRVVGALVRDGLAIDVTHAAGPGRDQEVRAAYDAAGCGATVVPYIDDMGSAYAQADFAICRAGATTIAELTAVGLGALYVPFPHAADDHQTANALAVVEAGGGVMLGDAEMAGERPFRLLSPLLRHIDVLEKMGAAARALGRPQAGRDVALDILAGIG